MQLPKQEKKPDLVHPYFEKYSQPLIGLGLLSWLAATIYVFLTYNGTYDAGDSIVHYQFAAYAFAHPEHLVDHWAKPFFTLCAAPFAQFGFFGMKVFNCLMVLWTAVMTWRIANRLAPRIAALAAIFVVCQPEVFLAQFSGLTEPMFAGILTVALANVLEGRTRRGFIYASLLPFVRTEGFLLLPVFAAFEVYRWWRSRSNEFPSRPFFQVVLTLAFLALGTAAYSLIGGLYTGDFLWVFHQNPYDSALDNYGTGDWLHFPQQYLFVLGVPLYGLFLLGLPLLLTSQFLPRRKSNEPSHLIRNTTYQADGWLLIAGLFFAYFGAHMVFWATGTAHSMGLLRVLIALAPLGALIALRGLQFILQLVRRWPSVELILKLAIPAYVVIFLFTPNPAAISEKDLRLFPDQIAIEKLYFPLSDTVAQAPMIYSSHPYVAQVFQLDPWSDVKHLYHITEETPGTGSLVFWDEWFGLNESGISAEYLLQRPDQYRLIKSVERPGVDEDLPQVLVFEYIAALRPTD